MFDTITGRITGEHPSNGWRLQLTDSTLLDGNEAYSLTTGELLWSLKDSDMSKHEGYSGPAGHRSFIIEKDRGNLTLVPDTDPTAMSKEAYSQTARRPAKPLVRAHLRKAVNKAQGTGNRD